LAGTLPSGLSRNCFGIVTSEECHDSDVAIAAVAASTGVHALPCTAATATATGIAAIAARAGANYSRAATAATITTNKVIG